MATVNMESLPSTLQIALAVVTGLVTVFLVKLYRVRSFIQKLQKHGLVRLLVPLPDE